MPKINVLPKTIAEKIAAGEVVEKPASVVKEIVENAIDAGATDITVEIRGGGILYMRVTDNGCGIKHDDVPTAFLRHATSKIVNESDLDSINTLGFRGEALAAISSVSRVEMLTKTEEDELGTRYVIEGGEEIAYEEAGCPDGTTIIVRDLFFNTPARMKFLHKDTSEANVVADLVEKIALSHPEIAFRFIRDGKTLITTSGDGKLTSVIYSVLGREFSSTLIPAKGGNKTVEVEGFVCKPIYCRPKRTLQYFFLNGRLIRCAAAISALEAAYKNSVMVGKFPACVLNITVNPETVDVNVHPAKTEVRFSDDRAVFDAIYFTVKNALSQGEERPTIAIKQSAPFKAFDRMTTEQYKQSEITEIKTEEKKPQKNEEVKTEKNNSFYYPVNTSSKPAALTLNNATANNIAEPVKTDVIKAESDETVIKAVKSEEVDSVLASPTEPAEDKRNEAPIAEPYVNEEVKEASVIPELRLIGEAFSTYIIVEKGNSVFFIDKHASHERILFEELKKNEIPRCQELLLPVTVKLSAEQYNAVLNSTHLLEKSGFEAEDFGNNTVIVRGVPASLIGEDVASLFIEVAVSLSESGLVEVERLETIYHTVACKAAIKAGYRTSDEEKLRLANEVLSRDDIFYCPHGRPVAFEIKKRDLEKQFGRIQ
ncbi:MAG: DNA mismatch repair endonuclease MutL [Clostridia bacterium]|nr:DNA mismatch repair endonuclease MutL [Clostridia bacterium]